MGSSGEQETTRRDDERILEVPTISDEMLIVTLSNEVRVQGVPVLQADIEANNGIVHVIEQILWPVGMNEESFGERSPLSIRSEVTVGKAGEVQNRENAD